MTYREIFVNNISNNDELGISLMSISDFIKVYAGILCCAAHQLAKEDIADCEFDGVKMPGKGVKNPGIRDILNILSDDFSIRGANIRMQNYEFIDWLMNQEIPEYDDEDEDPAWFSFDHVAEKWNEYVAIATA